jgi:hypothetical protein
LKGAGGELFETLGDAPAMKFPAAEDAEDKQVKGTWEEFVFRGHAISPR